MGYAGAGRGGGDGGYVGGQGAPRRVRSITLLHFHSDHVCVYLNTVTHKYSTVNGNKTEHLNTVHTVHEMYMVVTE